MALKSTIFKADLALADIDHACYTDLQLTLARHPSETDERMMVRLAALAISAHQLIQSLAIPQADKERLLAMTPASYIGKAAELARRV